MLTRKSVILAKIESTYGVDATPGAADAVLVAEPQPRVNGELLTRDYVRSVISPLQPVIGMKDVEITFRTELKGSGAAGTPPETGPLFRACGMDETIVASTSVTYQPVSENFESCTIYCYYDGMLHKILGCVGSFEIIMEAGKYGVINWNFRGLYATPIDQAIVSGTFDSTTPPIIYGASFSMGGYAAVINRLQLALNNEFARRVSANAAQGVVGFEITNRPAAGSFDPESVTEATNTFWADWENSTPQAMTIGPLGAAGNIIDIDCPKCVYNSIAWGDREGRRIYDIPFTIAQDAGDDEIVIAFT